MMHETTSAAEIIMKHTQWIAACFKKVHHPDAV